MCEDQLRDGWFGAEHPPILSRLVGLHCFEFFLESGSLVGCSFNMRVLRSWCLFYPYHMHAVAPSTDSVQVFKSKL